MTAALNLTDRDASFSALEAQAFDVLVIGAGITGAGVARDAAMRGLSVALVDANDIAAGTSSRSSKLVHGGLRYLVQGQVNVVREAANERRMLRRIAPHLAQTNPMIVPGKSKPALLKFKTGLVTYEKLGNVDASELHEMWDVERLAAEEPTMRTEGLAGALVYPEYLTDDARLTLANVRSAVDAGAVVVTYASVEEILVENGEACGAIVRDALAGREGGARVTATVVVNAAGPWVDAIRKLEDETSKPKLQLTKGIHVVVPHERLPVKRTVVMTTPDKRSIFVVPRGRFAYFGTTDTFYASPEYWPEITSDDVDYLLDVGTASFNTESFTHADVVSLWSGVRPLLGEEGKNPSEISRRDELMVGQAGVLSVAGGKLTSYRSMAERIADACEERVGRDVSSSRTAEEPLPGGDVTDDLSSIETQLQVLGLGVDDAERAARLYGGEAPEVYADETGIVAEVRFAVTHEGALTLEDYWVRRSARARFDDAGGMDSLEPAAAAMGELLHWTDEERERQVAGCRVMRQRELHCLKE